MQSKGLRRHWIREKGRKEAKKKKKRKKKGK
jgi:hypothetical protein